MTKLTLTDIKALRALAAHLYLIPSEIGYAVCPTRANGQPLKPQGAGRLGGRIGWSLVRRGLAYHASSQRSGFPAYSISAEGRAALAAHDRTARLLALLDRAGSWVSLIEVKHLRDLQADDLAALPEAVASGYIEQDALATAVRITDAGRAALAATEGGA